MLLISTYFSDLIKKYKAPKGMLYRIDSIHYSDNNLSGQTVLIFDQLLEEDTTDVTSRDGGQISSYMANGQSHQHTDLDHKCKFISISKDSNGAVQVWVEIYGELVSASRTELILEWFRKGI